MFSSIRTLLLVTAIAGVMALLSPVAHAEITITRAEVQWGDAVVMGRGAAANDTIYWEDDSFPANKRGKFSFRRAVPADCVGVLSTNFYPPRDVPLSNCTPPDSGEPGEPGPIPEPLVEDWTQPFAHQGDAVRAVGFASDGKGGTWVISGGEDAYLRTWDLQNVNPEDDDQELHHTIYDLEVSADGSIVVTGEGGWNGGPGSDTLRIWDADGFVDGTTAPIGFVYCVAISPDPENLRIVASGFYGDIVVYGPSGPSLLELFATKKTKKKRTKALAFSPDGAILASTSTAGRIQLWDFPEDCELDSCEPILRPESMSHGGSWVFPIAFAPYSESDNLTKIVSGSDGGTIKVWTIDFIQETLDVSSFPAPSGAVYSLDWWSPEDPEDSMIVAGGDGDITVYDAASMAILFQTVNAHAGRVNDVAFSPDGSMIASGGADGAVKLWIFGTP